MGEKPFCDDQPIYYISDSDVSDLISDLENKLSTGNTVFLDNSVFPWLADYVNRERNVHKIDFRLINKANTFYNGIDALLVKYGAIPKLHKPDSPCNLHLINPIANELANGTIATVKAVDPVLASYEKLGRVPKEHLGDAGQILKGLKNVMNVLYEYTKHVPKTPNFVADNLESLLTKIKKRFKWGEKASDKDISLVAASFAKAIETRNDTYIISDDDDIRQIAECLYKLFACEQTDLTKKQLDILLPIKIYVSKTDTNRYVPVFAYNNIIIGRKYSIKEQLTIHGKIGTEEGSKALQRSIEDTPIDARKTASKIVTYLNQKQLDAEKEKAAEKPTRQEPSANALPKDQLTTGQLMVPVEEKPAKAITRSAEEQPKEISGQTLEDALSELLPKKAAAEISPEPAEAATMVLIRETPIAQANPEGTAKVVVPSESDKELRELTPPEPDEPIEEETPSAYEFDKKGENFTNALDIIMNYARTAYENAAETPEKAKAMSALEGMLACCADEGYSESIAYEINILKTKDMDYKLKAAQADIEKIAEKIKELASQQNWYTNPANISAVDSLGRELKEADAKRENIEKIIKGLI